MRVRDVMSTPVVAVRPDASFKEIVDRMIQAGVSGLPVINDDGELVGIVSEADLVSKQAYGGRRRRVLEVLADFVAGGQTQWAVKARGLRADHVMSRSVITVDAASDLRVAMRRMVEERLKRVPVVEAGRVVGMLSRRDVLALYGRSDDELEEELSRHLADPLWTPEDAEVTAAVRHGVVVLEGSTRHPSDRRVLEGLIWSIPGVVAVDISALTAREEEPRVARS
jgi:CBS domain-containing protein